MSCLCCFILFWNTKYNSPHTFCLASYSVMFCDQCPALLQSINHEHCIRALGCDPSNQHATLSHTNWLIGFVGKSAPPVTFHAPWFPCGPVDTHSFPNISFAVTSTGLISERYLTAVSRLVYTNHCWRRSVGLICFGCVTTVILRKRQAAYRMLNHP
jgi:hypothetical protein